MSSSQSFGSCCVSGHLHEGEPKGQVTEMYGLSTYVTGEKGKPTILYITDIFGYQLPNARLLADEYASNGFYVLVPDFFKDDSLDHNILPKIAPLESAPPRSTAQAALDQTSAMTSLGPWLIRHREAVSKPLIEDFVKELRKDDKAGEGSKKIGAVGACWGGRYSILLAHGIVDAAVAVHPSFLAVTGDLEGINTPVSIGVGDKDGMFSEADQKKTQEYFSKELSSVPTEFQVYPNAVHGFAVRGDHGNEEEKKNKEKVTEQTVKWFQKHLA